MGRHFKNLVGGKVAKSMPDTGDGPGAFSGWEYWGAHKWWPFAHHKGGHHHHHKPQKPVPDDPTPSQELDPIEAQALLGLDARNIDGTENNPINTGLGSAGSQLLRVSDAHYQDGAGVPYSGANPREVSNVILDQDTPMPSSFGVSDLFTYFG